MNKICWKQLSDRWANEGFGKEHMDTIDYDAPRDFMDTMLNEANNNDSEIGYHTIAMSIVGISVAFTNRKDGTYLRPRSTVPNPADKSSTNQKTLFGWFRHSVQYHTLGISYLDRISRSSRKVLWRNSSTDFWRRKRKYWWCKMSLHAISTAWVSTSSPRRKSFHTLNIFFIIIRLLDSPRVRGPLSSNRILGPQNPDWLFERFLKRIVCHIKLLRIFILKIIIFQLEQHSLEAFLQ